MARFPRRGLAIIAACLTVTVSLAAVPKDMAMYVGGTIPNLKEKTEGRLSTSDASALTFQAKYDTPLSIPYKSITSLEYGQKAGRRVGMAILVSPLALFSKKRNHFLTVTYNDAAKREQAAVFELGKDIVRTTLTVLQVRTGKDVEPQDAEACKQFKTPKDCEGSK